MEDLAHYELIADVFRYPSEDYRDKVEAVRELVVSRYPEVADEIYAFEEEIAKCDLPKLQEIYLRSFDVQSVTTLDLGYLLFGDDYKRGELLVNLNREHKAVGNDCGTELADHLPNVLCLISKLGDAELRRDLVEVLLLPALSKIIKEFSPDRFEKKEEVYKKHYKALIETPEGVDRLLYLNAFKVLNEIVKKDFQVSPQDLKIKGSTDFLLSIRVEMETEESFTS